MIPVELSENGNALEVINCPACGGEHIHQRNCRVYRRLVEDGPGLVSVCLADRTEVVLGEPDDLPNRRDTIKIDFLCEECKDCTKYALVIEQHKGTTLIYWEKA